MNDTKKKAHVSKVVDSNRSRCRYTARPTNRVRIVSVSEFKTLTPGERCLECAAALLSDEPVSKNTGDQA